MIRISILLVSFFYFSSVSCRCSCLDRVVLLINEEDYRIISSPDYPRYYCPSLSCSWRVVAPYNESEIFFYADNLDLRDELDFLEFYDGSYVMSDEKDEIIPSMRCTGRGECQYSTNNNILTIRFVTSIGDIDRFGFQGTVSPYNRKLRLLTSTIGRYAIPIAVILILLIAFVTLFAFCWKRAAKVNQNQKEAEELLKESNKA